MNLIRSFSRSFVNKYTQRSHTCGQITKDDVGKRAVIYGWLQYSRFDNKILAIKDKYGTIQCILGKNIQKSFKGQLIHNESVLRVEGVVESRPLNQINKSMSTGQVEIHVDNLKIVSEAKPDLPILDRGHISDSTLHNRLAHRYLDIRNDDIQSALIFRAKVCKILRDKLTESGFLEVETPTLFSRTPGGANEFIVPTQLAGKFYSLTQSPQQLKQLLMIGQVDRYFQICRCYRDETGRTDRQPEFTQVDIELSFTTQELVMQLIDELIYDLMTKMFPGRPEAISSFDQSHAIPRMAFDEAFEKYGSDKPDLRFNWTIETDSDCLCIKIPHHVEKRLMETWIEVCKDNMKSQEQFATTCINSSPDRAETKITISDKSALSRKLLGSVRVLVARELQKQGHKVYRSEFEYLWVTDFPLFAVDAENQLEPNHHPFTAPKPDFEHLLSTDPLKVIAQHYDLVLNGQEVGGGSIRIHDAAVQEKIFTDILRCDKNQFDYFLEALRSGCPPHGGIALGLDRLVAILVGRNSIREVIAFPKSSSGRDVMTKCPQSIDKQVRKLYHVEVTNE